jgi:hypothetical protein
MQNLQIEASLAHQMRHRYDAEDGGYEYSRFEETLWFAV